MFIPTKTLNSGFTIPTLGFGTWKMGGLYTHDKNNDNLKDIMALKFALDSGLKAIDTAELYAGGYAETLVGQVIGNYDRDTLFISTKVIGANASYTAIKNACKNSLKRLKTNYIDLYYIHWRDTQFDLQEQMRAMNELVDEGYIRSIGVCNFNTESLKLAQSYSKHPIVANQVHYNLVFREPEADGLLKYCQQNDVMLIAWRPVQFGQLSGELELLKSMREKYQKSDGQIALNWLISQKNVVTLFKSCSLEHITQNLGALGWEMESEDIEYLRENFPGQIDISNAVPLA